MSSLMTSFWTGVSGLTVNQSALNTTGHNLTNIDTIGFVRQQILATDMPYNNIGHTSYNTLQIGRGTNMAVIRQVRDEFLDKSYRQQVGRQKFYEAQGEAVDELENIFGELEGAQFQDTIAEFWNSISALANEPDNIVKRKLLIDTAVTFAERAEILANQTDKYQKNLNVEITKQVKRINEIGDEIHELNKLIQRYESGGQQANDYRDARNNLLDELGEMVKTTYSEDHSGVVTVSVEGIKFVDEETVFKMDTETVTDKSSLLKVVWKNNGCGDVFRADKTYSTADKTDIGSLRGLLIARGDYKANYTDIPLKEQYETEQDYEKAVKEYNNNTDPSIIMSVQAQFDQLIHGIATTINNILSPNTGVSNYLDNLGIKKQENSSISVKINGVEVDDVSKIHVWDEGLAPVGMDKESTGREALFNRKNTERYTEAQMSYIDENGKEQTRTVYVYNEEDPNDPYSLFTATEIEVNPNLLKECSLLPLSGNKWSGMTNGYEIKVCEQLLKAWKTPFATLGPNTESKDNFDDYYTSLIGAMANRGKVTNDIINNQADLVKDIDAKRQGVAGVSSNEELTNLVKFQHAYNANSRYINVIDEMLEHIISRLG